MLKDAKQKWGVVSTRPGRERLALAQLSNQGIEAFLPQLKKSVSRRGRRIVERAPLFTGYLFLAVGRDVARWRSINGTIGVKCLLMQNEQPALVPYDFIEMLRCNCNEDGTLAYHRWLSPGDTASIVAGPLSSRIGKLLSIDAKGRVELLVEMLSSTVPVKMNVDNLMPA